MRTETPSAAAVRVGSCPVTFTGASGESSRSPTVGVTETYDVLNKDDGGLVSEVVSIRPGVGMLGLFPHMKYQPWYAVGELVDNAIQSFLANREALERADGSEYRFRVEIAISKDGDGLVSVRDNAAGIATGDWGRAFKVAEPPDDASGLSQFGVGMKAACCWFAREWSVRTTHLGEKTVRSVVFDVPAIIASREETLTVHEEPTSGTSHFTEIRMIRLHRVPQRRTLGKMRAYLGSMYREFLRSGDIDIIFNDEPVVFEELPVLEATLWSDPAGPVWQWHKQVDLLLDSGRRVHGFAALREKGSTNEAGLALLHRAKVVTGAGEETYKPDEIFGRSNSYRSQRLFGELHMDDFDVTYTKDALVWYDEEEEFIERLRAVLDEDPLPLLRQAENFRVRRPEVIAHEIVDDVRSRIMGVLPSALELSPLNEGTEMLPAEPDEETESARSLDQSDRFVTMTVSNRPWNVHLGLISDESRGDWLSVRRTNEIGESNLEITVNLLHPFMRNFAELPTQELEPVWRLAIALGLAQELARDSGDKAAYVLLKVNSLLRDYLGQQAGAPS